MKIPANSIKKGMILVHDKELWSVTETMHVKPGKGPAYQQLVMKNTVTGTKTYIRLSASDTAEKAELEQGKYQYLYVEDNNLIFMDLESGNFDQISVSKELFGEQLPFLEDGMIVKIEFYQEKPLKVELPSTVILEITETDPVMRGATATSSYKPAIMQNGIRVMIPPYIVTGEKIVVKTEDSSYVERAK